MSQVAMTVFDRVRALERFGYTEPEASFLCLAALHGGYFVRRQYAEFLRRQDGGTVTQLIEKTLDREHAYASTYTHKMQVYHLSARPLYAALGQVDNRNRRRRQLATIKNKIMGLDFVVAHRDYSYLATEQEKLAYFVGTLQIPVSNLPAKLYLGAKGAATTARYFVDKYPMFLSEVSAAGSPPVVTFCFVDEGQTTLSHFETFLAHYRPLFASLPEFGLTYVAATDTLFMAAQRTFERFAGSRQTGKNGAVSDPDVRRLQEHFEARRLYEAKRFAEFDREKLIRLRNELAEFSGKENDALYDLWKTARDGVFLQKASPKSPTHTRLCGTFSTYLLEHRYDFLGTLTAF
jgi:hypothetical protein